MGKSRQQRAAQERVAKQMRMEETGQFVKSDEPAISAVDVDVDDDLLVDEEGHEMTLAAYYAMAKELPPTDVGEEGKDETDDDGFVITGGIAPTVSRTWTARMD